VGGGEVAHTLVPKDFDQGTGRQLSAPHEYRNRFATGKASFFSAVM